MKNAFYSSKDEIRNRILKNARDFWGIRNINDLDPFVKLIIEALSSELFNISNDLQDVEGRILNKISRVLASDLLTSPLPAHAILHADPIEKVETLDHHVSFFYRKKLQVTPGKAEKPLDIFFSALEPVKIFKAGVKFMVSGSNLFEFDDQLNKSLLFGTVGGASVEPNTIWLGLNADAGIPSLKGMSFYFDWRSYVVSNEIQSLLPLSKWYLGGREINMVAGLFEEAGQEREAKFIFKGQDIMNLIAQDIKAYYHHKFITFDSEEEIIPAEHLKDELPEFAHLFPSGSAQQLKDRVIWLKINFPAVINAQMLDELHVAVNAFPVVNKKLYEDKHRPKATTNIIPVKTNFDEHMLAIHNLQDNLGRSYSETPYTKSDSNNEGAYSVRYGGAERFDGRNAHETIEYLFELLRDEKAAFSAYGVDFLNNILKSLEQNIALVEQKTTSPIYQLRELINYIIVKPLAKADIMFLEYWTTYGDLGNKIRVGTRLQQFESSKVNGGNIQLLSNTVGGRNRLKSADRIQAYKYGLTTRDRIVTKADIVNFCFYELGSKISAVDIRKGVMASQVPKEGFKKTIDIYLRKTNSLDHEEMEGLLGLLKPKLELRSMMHVHYRFFIDN